MQRVVPFKSITAPPPSAPVRGSLLAAAIHGLALFAIFGVLHHQPRIAPHRFPGTAKGIETLVYYSPGSPASSTGKLVLKKPVHVDKPTPTAPAKPVPLELAETHAPIAEAGIGSAAVSGFGEGNISMALQKYFPHPAPDLSPLLHGTRGDVVLNAVIDEQGRISDLTLVKGLAPSIDQAVMATVRQWTYTPAMKDGIPVPSEQELHFHYERS
jgi:protein TonB